MAGDFNATLDHFARFSVGGAHFGECRDAAALTGNAAVGTWPTDLPALLGTPIDHVLSTPNWRVSGARVLDAPGSDHRALLAQLSRRLSGGTHR